MARSIVGHCLRHLCALGVLAGYASPAWSQTPDGARVFQASCATCHTDAPDSRAPGIDSLRVRTPQAILDSLVTGAMRPQGSRLSGPERRAVAVFITGKSIEGDVSGARVGRCSTSGPLQDLTTGAIRWARQVTTDDIYVSNCAAGNPNCPDTLGPDHDFGSPPVLARAGNRDVIVIGQKSGLAFAMDPDKKGEILWQYRAGQGGVLGGMEWGAAADAERAYFAVSDITTSQPGGLHAVNLATGTRAWFMPPQPPTCTGSGRGCNAAQSAAVTAIAGAVFSASDDGSLRAFSTSTGELLWQFDTNRDFSTVNGVPARGASINGPGAVVAGGMVYVNSGFGAFGGRPGNVLLAFGPE